MRSHGCPSNESGGPTSSAQEDVEQVRKSASEPGPVAGGHLHMVETSRGNQPAKGEDSKRTRQGTGDRAVSPGCGKKGVEESL